MFSLLFYPLFLFLALCQSLGYEACSIRTYKL
jgi:hypothetical protein